MTSRIISTSSDHTLQIAENIGLQLAGGEVISLVGDIGAGKTTFTKGLATGLGCKDELSSPSFTIMRDYECAKGVVLKHYDFYRLSDPGIMSQELSESIGDKNVVSVIEWPGIIDSVLSGRQINVSINTLTDDSREFIISSDIKLDEKGLK